VILAMRRRCFGAGVSYQKRKRKRKTAAAIFLL
jgi:hypothetical protein